MARDLKKAISKKPKKEDNVKNGFDTKHEEFMK